MPEKSTDFGSSERDKPDVFASIPELHNFPSVGRLFASDDDQDLVSLLGRYEEAKLALQKIIRNADGTERESAQRCLEAITLTIEFLETVKDSKASSQETLTDESR